MRAMQYLDRHVGLGFLSSKKLPEDVTSMPKHVGV